MIKRDYMYILFFLLFFVNLTAQEETIERNRTPRLTRESDIPAIKSSIQRYSDSADQPWEDTNWYRIIYRELDLKNELNTPLYYPLQPKGNQQSLFTLVINLIRDDQITAYEYIDGYELFDDVHRWSWDKWTDFQQTAEAISTEDVLHWYMKEVWFLDRSKLDIEVKILALCPVVSLTSEFGIQRRALFWIEFDSLNPFISQIPIMVSNRNNALTYSMDDYFRRRLFKGEIIKTENLLNLTLNEQYPDRDSLKIAQEIIEEELKSFKKSLYSSPDSGEVQDLPLQRTQKQSRITTGSPTKTEKSTPVRSVRRR